MVRLLAPAALVLLAVGCVGGSGGSELSEAERERLEQLEEERLVAFDEPFWFAIAAFRPDVRIVR